MPSPQDLYALSDDSLLTSEERFYRLKYRLMAMIASHLSWSTLRLVFDWTKTEVIHPHIIVAMIGILCYYAGELFKVDLHLLQLRQEIGSRPGLVRRRLILRDYMQVAATGMSLGLGTCGAVEVLDHSLGVRNAGAK